LSSIIGHIDVVHCGCFGWVHSFLAALVNQWVRKNVPGLSIAFGSISLHQVAMTRIHTRFPRVPGIGGRWISITGGAAVRSLTWRLCRRGRPFAIFVEGIAVRVRIADAGPVAPSPITTPTSTTPTLTTMNVSSSLSTQTSTPMSNTTATFAETELRQRRTGAIGTSTPPPSSSSLLPSLSGLSSLGLPKSSSSTTSDGRPLNRSQRIQKWLLSNVVAPLTKMIAIVVDDVHIIVQHGDAEFHLDDFGVAVALGDGISKSHQRLMVELAAFSMNILGRDPTLAMPTSVRFAASALLTRTSLPKNAPPPLAFIRQLKFTADIVAPKFIPLGVDSVELTGPGMHFSLDPGHQLAPVIALLRVIMTPQPSSVTAPPLTPVGVSSQPLSPTTPVSPTSPQLTLDTGSPTIMSHQPTTPPASSSLGPSGNIETSPPLHLIPKKISAKLDHLQLDIHQRSFFEPTQQSGDVPLPHEEGFHFGLLAQTCAKTWWGGAHATPTSMPTDNVMEISMTEISVGAVVTGRDELDHIMDKHQQQRSSAAVPLFCPNHVQWTGSIRTPRLTVSQAPTLPIFSCEYVKVTGTGSQSVVMIAPAPAAVPQSLLHGRLAALSTLSSTSDLLAATPNASPYRPTSRSIPTSSGSSSSSSGSGTTSSSHQQRHGHGAHNHHNNQAREHGLQTMHQIGLVLLTVRVNIGPHLAPWVAYFARTAYTLIGSLPAPSADTAAAATATAAPIPPTAAKRATPPSSAPVSPEQKQKPSHRPTPSFTPSMHNYASTASSSLPFTTHSNDTKRAAPQAPLQRMVSRSALDPFSPVPALPSLPPIVNFSMKVMDTQVAFYPPPSWPGHPAPPVAASNATSSSTVAAAAAAAAAIAACAIPASIIPSLCPGVAPSTILTDGGAPDPFASAATIAAASTSPLPSSSASLSSSVPMLLISIGEVTLRLEEATSPVDASPVQVVVLQISELHGDLPLEKFDPHSLTTHSEETLKSPGRFISVVCLPHMPCVLSFISFD
jgi:hypothetical protein